MNILITASSTDIGIDLISRFLKIDCKIFLITNNEEALRATQKKYSNIITIIKFDLLQKDSPNLVYEKLKQQNISIDLLINIPEIEGSAKFSKKAVKEYFTNIETLGISLHLLSLIFATDMYSRNNGKILNIGSLIYLSSSTFFQMETVVNEIELESKITSLCQNFDNSTLCLIDIYKENLQEENKIWNEISAKYSKKDLHFDKIIKLLFNVILNKRKLKLLDFLRF